MTPADRQDRRTANGEARWHAFNGGRHRAPIDTDSVELEAMKVALQRRLCWHKNAVQATEMRSSPKSF